MFKKVLFSTGLSKGAENAIKRFTKKSPSLNGYESGAVPNLKMEGEWKNKNVGGQCL